MRMDDNYLSSKALWDIGPLLNYSHENSAAICLHTEVCVRLRAHFYSYCVIRRNVPRSKGRHNFKFYRHSQIAL